MCVGGWCMAVNVYVLLCITTLYMQPYIQADLYTGSVLMHECFPPYLDKDVDIIIRRCVLEMHYESKHLDIMTLNAL